jgi:sugar O-acyltransferase (sialic acid O-acetyltransferase NeuD family)
VPVDARRPVVIIGAAGHGRQVRDIIEEEDRTSSSPRRVLGFLDDGPVDEDLLARRGDRLLGPTSMLTELDRDVTVAIGVSAPAIRRRLALAVIDAGLHFESVVHPRAVVGSLVQWGPGLMLSAGAILDTNVTLGRLCHLNYHADIGHDTVLGDHVTMLPGARVSGSATIGDDVLIATNAVVFPGVTVGDRVRIGAGAVVRKDVAPDTTVFGPVMFARRA